MNAITGELEWTDFMPEVEVEGTKLPPSQPAPVPIVTPEKGYDGQKVASFALTQERLYLRGDQSVSLKEIRPYSLSPIKGKTRYDCTGFLGYALATFYPGLAKKLDLGPASNVEYWAKRNGGIRQSNPKVGDIAIWKQHAEIVTSVHGTTFTTMGSSGSYGSWQPSPKSFGPQGKNNLEDYGNGTFLGFWTPVLNLK
jgi:hypothetical protein